MSTEFIIYCDESARRGNYFSNFYGGALVRSGDLEFVRSALSERKAELNLHGEVKWQKVTDQYLSKYVALTDTVFDLLAGDRLKMRIMFTQNRHVPQGLSRAQVDDAYHLLYYQFLKHAFGLDHVESPSGTRLRIYLDTMPSTREQVAQFKAYLAGLSSWKGFRARGIHVEKQQIAEVNSHEHDILQCLDVVLGAMQFRLNDLHRAKAPDTHRRGKRTLAKERLYRHIAGRIRQIHPRFNVGITTGLEGDIRNRWRHSYRHWLFVPSLHQIDDSQSKPE